MKRIKFRLAAICVILSSLWGSALHAKIDVQDSEERSEILRRIFDASVQISGIDAQDETTQPNRFAQWYNWGNWSNWPNWRNWVNW